MILKTLKKNYLAKKNVFNVFRKFEIKTMKDYHDLYLKCDALL